MGSLETTKPKSVMARIRQRGQQDIVGFRGDKQELEKQVIKDLMGMVVSWLSSSCAI